MLTRLWSSELPYVIVTALVLTALLLRARPGERSTYQNTLWLFLLGKIGLAAAHGAGLLGFDTAARLLEVLFRIVWTIALIRIAGFALFRLVLPKIGKPMPRIVEDLGIIAVYAAYGLSQMRLFGVDLTGILATSAPVRWFFFLMIFAEPLLSDRDLSRTSRRVPVQEARKVVDVQHRHHR